MWINLLNNLINLKNHEKLKVYIINHRETTKNIRKIVTANKLIVEMKWNTKKSSCNPKDAKEKKMDKEEMGPIENNNKIGDLNIYQ